MRAALAAIVAAVIAAVLVACGSQPAAHPKVHVHGTLGMSFASNCTAGTFSAGDQVKITAAGGRVLATPTLGQPESKTLTVSGQAIQVTEYPFSATVPPESRYGLTAASLPTYYVSEAQFRKGVNLSC